MSTGNGVTLSKARSGTELDVFAGTDPAAVARAFKTSGMFPDLESEAQAFVKIMAGRELGIGPMAAMMGINVIQGKVTLSSNLMAAKVKASGTYTYLPREISNERVELEFLQNGESIGVSEFSIEDAQRAGLLKGQNWQKYPKAMLFARSLSQGVRWYCPDVLSGAPAYVPEEMGAEVNEEGEAVRIPDQEPVTTDEPEVVVGEVVDEGTEPGPVRDTITKTRAGAIYDTARQVTSIDPDSLAQAVAYASQRETVGDLSTKKAAVPVLAEMTEEQADRLEKWIARKAEAENGSGSGGGSGE